MLHASYSFAAALHTAYDGKDTSTKLVIERSVLPDSPLHNDAGEALL